MSNCLLFSGHCGEETWTALADTHLERLKEVSEVKIRVNVWTVRRDTKKWPPWRGGRCRVVAVVEKWPFVEVRLYF